MRVLFSAVICLALAGSVSAQRGGGGMRGGGGGFGGGLRGGGGGFHGGAGGFGGFRGGSGGFGGFRGGGGSFGGFRGGGFRGFDGFRGFRGFGYGGSYLGFGLGYGYGYGSPYLGYGYPYLGGYWDSYAYDPYAYGYAAAPAVTVVYPQAQSMAPIYVVPQPERANPVTHEYDQYGQEVRGGAPTSGRASSPIYLFAFQDHAIRAANAYWVEGKQLHYVTLQHEERQAPIDTLDRALTLQLNRERQVNLELP
jgi:hypothetical protein